MNIKAMIADLIQNREGGYVNDPDDRGGATKYGITQQTLSDYLGRPASVQEVEALDTDTAEKIYLANYYIAAHVDKLPGDIQPQVFDMCVNHGCHKAIVILQRALNSMDKSLKEDGNCGALTLQAAQDAVKQMGDKFNNAISAQRCRFYANILASDPSQGKFFEGWIHRAESFRC